jgi:hypothetical protein
MRQRAQSSDYVEDRLARHGGYCTCGSLVGTERFDWDGPVLDDRRRDERGASFWKAWCQGACGRGWRLDPDRREARNGHAHDPLVLFDGEVTEDLIAAGSGLVDAPSPADRYAPFIEPFGPLEFDRQAQLPVVWGFPIAAWASDCLVEAIDYDVETVFLGIDHGQDHSLRCSRTGIVTLRLHRVGAPSVYGPYQGDNFEYGYGSTRWLAAGFGAAWFASRWLAPDDEERADAEAGWRERVERERAEQAKAAAESEEAWRRDAEVRRVDRAARAVEALELLGGPMEPPEGFADYLGGFEAVTQDALSGETVAWGFPIQRRISPTRWQELRRHGELVYVGESPGMFQSSPGTPTWVLVCRTLTREVAMAIYGPVTHEERGPRGGWRSATFGGTTFGSRRLAD